MKIALCQLNPVTGNIEYNTSRIIEELAAAAALGAELIIFPELSLLGYPPKDLLEYTGFIRDADEALVKITAACRDHQCAALVGTALPNTFSGKKSLLNAGVFTAADGSRHVTYKKLLPTYDVFDEHRYFDAAPPETIPPLLHCGNKTLAVTVCEDIWNDNEFWQDERLYPCDPVHCAVDTGADFIVNISASPFVYAKGPRRLDMLRHTAARWQRPVIFVNQVGGCDQVIFDGGSAIVMPDGTIPVVCGWFSESTCIWDTEAPSADDPKLSVSLAALEDQAGSVTSALTLGLQDYMLKTGFTQVLVGNSGGIDSAVVLALAVKALGAGNVISATMPGRYSSSETHGDAGLLANALGVRHVSLPIQRIHDEFSQLLTTPGTPIIDTLFSGDRNSILRLADENVQARIRGNILMYISNAIGSARTLVLSTGNKSELAVGYCTLYGDMCGGLALISDVPKMMVYRVATYLNQQMNNAIPHTIIDRAPSAELAPDQKDSDSLPPYPVLDEIIRLFVEERLDADEIIAAGAADEAVVRRVVRMIETAEYKRAQAAPGLKVTSKAFGFGRRMPIARGTPARPGAR